MCLHRNRLGKTFARPSRDSILTQIPIGTYTLIPVGGKDDSMEIETAIPPESFQSSTFHWAAEDGTLYDGREAQSYRIIQSGTTYWLAENLRYQIAGSSCNPSEPSFVL